MIAAPRGPVMAFLLRAGLLTAALAIMAGIFGMHIMTGAHSMPTSSTGATMAQLVMTPPAHVSHAPIPSSDLTADAEPVSGSPSLCAPASPCPEMSAMDAACVLSLGNTPFSAPLPGTAPIALPDLAGAVAVSTSYYYSPGSPSPGELCISRT